MSDFLFDGSGNAFSICHFFQIFADEIVQDHDLAYGMGLDQMQIY